MLVSSIKMAVHAALRDSLSLHSLEPSAGPSGAEFNFLYSPEVGETVEVPGNHEESQRGRKRVRNPENWNCKHLKKPGLRKNAPHLDISSLQGVLKTLLSKSSSKN